MSANRHPIPAVMGKSIPELDRQWDLSIDRIFCRSARSLSRLGVATALRKRMRLADVDDQRDKLSAVPSDISITEMQFPIGFRGELGDVLFQCSKNSHYPLTNTRGSNLPARPDQMPRLTRRGSRNPYYKESNSSGWCGGPHGNNLSDQAFRVHCTMTVYIDTSKSCDVPGTPDITDWFSCGLPSTTHTLLIQASSHEFRIHTGNFTVGAFHSSLTSVLPTGHGSFSGL